MIYIILAVLGVFYLITDRGSIKYNLLSFLVGVIFGLGLMISGMTKITKIIGFLTLNSNWDPALMFVMVGALAFNFISFRFILSSSPLYSVSNSGIPKTSVIDFKLLLGAAIFGLGWGLSGLCPGPGMINFFIVWNIGIWIAGLAVG